MRKETLLRSAVCCTLLLSASVNFSAARSISARSIDTQPIKLSISHDTITSVKEGSQPNIVDQPSSQFHWNSISEGDILMKGKILKDGGCQYPGWSVFATKIDGKVRSLTIKSERFVCQLQVSKKSEVPLKLSTALNASFGTTRHDQVLTIAPVFNAKPITISDLVFGRRVVTRPRYVALKPQCTPYNGAEAHSEWWGRDFTWQDVFSIHAHLEYDYDCFSVSGLNGYGMAMAMDAYWDAVDGGDSSGGDFNTHSGGFWTNYDSGNAWSRAYASPTGAYVQCGAGSSGFTYTGIYQFNCW